MRAPKPVARTMRRLFRLCLVQGELDETRVRQAMQQLIAGGHRRTRAMLMELRRLARLHDAEQMVRIESAVPLPEPLRQQLCALLARRYGTALHSTFAEDPQLIAGVRIQVGSEVYDDSLRARLARVTAPWASHHD